MNTQDGTLQGKLHNDMMIINCMILREVYVTENE